MPEEIRTTNEQTGGQKGSKIQQYALIPTYPLGWLAEMYGRGAQKYEPRNWERGYAWSLSYSALQRHANAFWSGEDLIPQNEAGDDPTAGVPHLTAVAWHAFALLDWSRTHPELDDRSKGLREGRMFFGRLLTDKQWAEVDEMTSAQQWTWARTHGLIE